MLSLVMNKASMTIGRDGTVGYYALPRLVSEASTMSKLTIAGYVDVQRTIQLAENFSSFTLPLEIDLHTSK